MQNCSAEVDAFMETLEHPMAELVQQIRLGFLSAVPELTEHIKWNAPSFCMAGTDRVTFNLRPTDGIHLIFHRGAKPVEDDVPFHFDDPSGLLSMITPERGQVVLADASAVKANEQALQLLVRDWVRA
ncbi:DUF1801 domain-containing protein [Demequina sp. TTPB684]|uniref:DUF1801 domain-containing protein n=1 Tax=unclassified Demequina TaxID=2620311 RepID=UPI001CF14AD6|nr:MULTISPECIES: DUF1801 domain-containing protein [unclassified Demequina]MCB2412764.1 DUF1801 domain-containing protein [Demequina sp. TTPB684]UPU88859.1 DUF1801 domain-containing protein [Demequina sp. TMPB413]